VVLVSCFSQLIFQRMHPKMYMYKRVVEAKLFIDRNYAQKIELDKIAHHAHFSKYHFLRLFKNAFGMSPNQYLTTVRLSSAKKQLAGNKPVTEVCFAVGFSSVSSFTHLFKKHVGKSPKEFQIIERTKLEQIKEKPFSYVPNCFAESYGWKKSNSRQV